MSFFLFNYLAQCKSMIQSSHDIKECGMSPTLSSMAFAKSLIYSSKGDLEIKYKQKLMRCLKVVILFCKFCIFYAQILVIQTVYVAVHLLHLHMMEHSCDELVCTACFGIIISFLHGKSCNNKVHMSLMSDHIFKPQVIAYSTILG